MYGRLAALPDSAAPLQRSQLLAALSVGSEIMHLRRIISLLGLGRELDAALAGLAEGQSAIARAGLARIDPGAGGVRVACLEDAVAGVRPQPDAAAVEGEGQRTVKPVVNPNPYAGPPPTRRN